MFTGSYIPGRCTSHALIGAHSGITYSFPLLDRRLIEFSLSLPLDHFLADGFSRQPFRRAMKGILPEVIRTWPHKYMPTAAWIPQLATEKASYLGRAHALRNNAVATAVFDMDAIIRDLAAIPEGDDALALAQDVAAQGRAPNNLLLRIGASQLALNMAEHLARLDAAMSATSSSQCVGA